MPAYSFGYFYGRVTVFIINFVGNELMAMLIVMALQALPRSGVTYLSYRSSVIKANVNVSIALTRVVAKHYSVKRRYTLYSKYLPTRLN